MTPSELKVFLDQLLSNNIQISTMIWGPPGIGKSSIVGQLAKECDIDFVDVSLISISTYRFARFACC